MADEKTFSVELKKSEIDTILDALCEKKNSSLPAWLALGRD